MNQKGASTKVSTSCLSPHLNTSPGAHSLGEVICPVAVFDAESFLVLDCFRSHPSFNSPQQLHHELVASV